MEWLRGMAIYHLHSSYGSRRDGRSARAELLYVLRRGPFADGSDKLLASEWGHLPQWCGGDDPLPLFAASDLYERANGRLYCELEGALPTELDLEQGIELTRAVAEAVTANGLPYAWGIHEGRPPEPGKPRNRHWHLIYLERIEDGIAREPAAWFRRANRRRPAEGGAPKDASLKGHEWVRNTRRLYERLLNEALERAGCPERVTCESHRTRMARAEDDGDHETAEYLLRHPPGLHIGPRACAIERGSSERPGRTTDRGNRARAREAKAQHLRAEIESVKRELKDLYTEDRVAAEAAARDAGVDVAAVIDAAGFSDKDQANALLTAAEGGRVAIHQEARAAGLDDDAIDRIRRTAEPDDPDLGWAAVGEATTVRCKRWEAAETVAHDVGVDVDAACRQARERNEDELDFLERETAESTLTAARAALLDDDAIARIRRGADSKGPGSEWMALAKATEQRVKQKEEAEADAGRLRVDVDEVYTDARKHGQDPVVALERANDEREEEHRIQAAGRQVFLEAEAIERIRREAETNEVGSGWAAVEKEIKKRKARKTMAEEAARGLVLKVDVIYANATQHGADPLDHLEKTTEIWQTAREAGLGNNTLNDVYARAEERKAGTGWTAVSNATRDIKRKQAVEEEARQEFVDIGAVYDKAGLDRRDPLAALEAATTVQRGIRQEAEADAGRLGVDVDAVYTDAQQNGRDPVAALKRANEEQEEEHRIRAAARQVFLDDKRIDRIRREAEAGSEWGGVEEEIRRRQEQKTRDEGVARRLGLDVDTIYGNAGPHGDPLDLLTRAIEIKQEWEQARRRVEHERRRNAERRVRTKRIERQFVAPDRDRTLFETLDQSSPDWRTKGASEIDVDRALDIVESRRGRSLPSTGLHALVVAFEKAHPDASSPILRRVGSAFTGSDAVDRKAREASNRLADRAFVRQIVTGRSEPSASGGLVQRLIEWLRTHVVRLLDTLRRADGPPSPEVTARTTSPAESSSSSAPHRPTGLVRPEPPATGTRAQSRDEERGADPGRQSPKGAETRPEGSPKAVAREPLGDQEPREQSNRQERKRRPEKKPTQEQEERSRAFELRIATIEVAKVLPRERPDPIYRPDIRCVAISEQRRAVLAAQLMPLAKAAFTRAMEQDDAGDAAQRAAAESRLHVSDEMNRELVARIEKAVPDVLERHSAELRPGGGPDGRASEPTRKPRVRLVPEPSPSRRPSRK